MNNLFELRKRANLTQNDMANILGVTRQAYSRYELEERELGYEMLAKLANYFNVPVDYILGLIEKVNLRTITNMAISPEESDLLIVYRELRRKEQLLILQYAEKLNEELFSNNGPINKDLIIDD